MKHIIIIALIFCGLLFFSFASSGSGLFGVSGRVGLNSQTEAPDNAFISAPGEYFISAPGQYFVSD